ncbi:WD REPEAT-CONTAINING PROTEIN 36 [Salix purpurea]|uniref:WD REPEAT-CONTAINING PROTEIN 36 n=1 Tax=Salix purpurea TaxID=77065 RepID=A0A9Q0Q475_SALPP|nr:WD REPEAT-CONTAINING PROTEIN 36 [Salix purpurea]
MGIFEPFRAIGYITTGVPFAVQRLGTETFVTVSVGKAFQVYNCAKLTLVIVSPQLPHKIRALACYRDFTFVAYATHIAVFKRAHQVALWTRHSAKVNSLFVFGDYVISVDVDGNLFIWGFKGVDGSNVPVGHILLGDKFIPTCMMHPDTYLNKVLIGSQEGGLQLWNMGRFMCIIFVMMKRWSRFVHSMRGAVTSLSFSTDGQPLLASGGSSGVISIWNLEKRKLQSVQITLLKFGFLIQLMEILDFLRFRSGHSAPPLCIRFYANGRHILSAGQDRAFRLFSVIQDQQSRELSQRHVSKRAKKLRVKEEELKLKPVIAFDCAEIRERDWCNVVTCHMDTAQAYVWRLQNFVIGEHILRPCPENPTPVKACTISACGNFAIIGTASGWIERFNLQSGISRGRYLDVSERGSCAHESEVVGVACDSTNTQMISAGYHGDVKVWDFKGCVLKSRWEVGCSLVKIVYHRLNGLLATVADDFIIRLYDAVALRMVRKFEGHTDRITDLCFSEDGKWLLSSSMDGTLRIWDVILARQIDAVHVDVSITALSLSPNMDVLATTHVDQNGVYLWVNQSMFSGASNIDSYASGKEVVNVKLPSLSSVEGSNVENEDTDKPTVNQSISNKVYTFPAFSQQIPDLVTLSLLPKSQWQGLINLDIIKVRNKPIEPPKKPEKAPFFLPSVPSLSGEILFKPSEPVDGEDIKPDKAESDKRKLDIPATQFLELLQSSSETKNFSAFTEYIKGLSPSNLDLELRMFQIIDEDEDEEELVNRPEFISIELLLDYFIHEISCRNNFEFIQAVTRLFLKIHGETIRCNSKLQDKARKLLDTQSAVWQRVDKLFQSARCMVTFLSNSQF